MNQRKVIQLTSCRVDNNLSTQCNFFLHALCDDGSMWSIRDNEKEWFQVPQVPNSPEIAEEKKFTTHNSS